MTTTARPRSSLNRGPQFAQRHAPPVPETLEDTGLIKAGYRGITILDMQGLRKLAGPGIYAY